MQLVPKGSSLFFGLDLSHCFKSAFLFNPKSLVDHHRLLLLFCSEPPMASHLSLQAPTFYEVHGNQINMTLSALQCTDSDDLLQLSMIYSQIPQLTTTSVINMGKEARSFFGPF